MNLHRSSKSVRSSLLFLALLASVPAAAQTSLGVSPPAPAGVFSVQAYDDKHHVFLQVWEFNRDTWGRFLNAAGQPVGGNFVVATNKQSFTGKPRVAYSRDNAGIDEFLVSYVTDINKFDSGSNIYAQRVQFTGSGGQLLGGPIPVSENSINGNVREVNNDVIFNPLNGRFLVAWEEYIPGADVLVRHIAADGTLVGASKNVSAGPGGQGAAGLALDWKQNRYFVTYIGDDTNVAGGLGTFGHLLDGNSLQVLTSPRILIDNSLDIEPAAVFLPERDGFLSFWTGFTPGRDILARFVPTAYGGSLSSPAFMVMGTPSVNEGFTAADYDFVSRTVLVNAMRDPKFIGCVALNGQGAVITAPTNCSTTNPASGSFYPNTRPAEGGVYGTSYITDYTQAWVERFQLTPAQSPGPKCCGAAPPPPPGVHIQVDTPTANQTITPPFGIAGWALDQRTSNGAGVDMLHIWAVPLSGATPLFVGVAPVGYPRPDVGGAYGAQYTNSGFGISLSNIPPGAYQLVFYPHSSVSGQFEYDRVATTNVNIVGGALTSIDTPGWGQVLGGNAVGALIAGWAIDLVNQNGTGVDAVHVWAINANTGATTFMGAAQMGIQRVDVKNAFGARFEFSGYGLQNGVPLPPGTYYIAVFSHSVGAGSFNIARIVGVQVQ